MYFSILHLFIVPMTNDIKGFVFSLKNPEKLYPDVTAKFKSKINVCVNDSYGVQFGNEHCHICIGNNCDHVGKCFIYALSGYYKFFPLFECRVMKDLPSNYKNQFIVLDYEVFTQM